MRRFVEEADRGQWTLLPECLDDFIDESNPVRVIDVFVDALDLAEMSFEGVEPAATGRPSYHPSVLLKLYIYGYLNRVRSSRRLEREAQRNIEIIWLLRGLKPDLAALERVDARGIIVTSRATTPGFDFVSRFFAPQSGVPEDPVTGSAHCALAPFWSERLQRTEMTAYQASPRGGVIRVRLKDDRVMLAGQAVTVLRGELLS